MYIQAHSKVNDPGNFRAMPFCHLGASAYKVCFSTCTKLLIWARDRKVEARPGKAPHPLAMPASMRTQTQTLSNNHTYIITTSYNLYIPSQLSYKHSHTLKHSVTYRLPHTLTHTHKTKNFSVGLSKGEKCSPSSQP